MINTTVHIAERFEKAWQQPTAVVLGELLHPDCSLYQPYKAVIKGKQAAIREFDRLLTDFPGFTGKVERSLSSGDLVFIEWIMKIPLGKKIIRIRTIDSITTKDALIYERRACFNTGELIRPLLANPRYWPILIKLVRSGKPANVK